MKALQLLKRALAATVVLSSGCGGQTLPINAGSAPASMSIQPRSGQTAYWTLYTDSTNPQMQFAPIPLKKKSTTVSSTYSQLSNSSGMRFDRAGRLWVLNSGGPASAANAVSVFTLPVTPKSTPKFQFLLADSNQARYLAFDPSGNLWISSTNNNAVIEYAGPFTKSGSLRPKLKLTKGVKTPWGLAFDKHGNLYIANAASFGTSSVAIFSKPIRNQKPKYLNGLYNPSALIFDAKGNLYAASDASGLDSVSRFNSADLKPGSKPSVTDSHGVPGAFSPVSFALSGDGDLYVTVCSSYSSIIVFPTGKKKFSNTLAPSKIYRNSVMQTIGCVWGIAIK